MDAESGQAFNPEYAGVIEDAAPASTFAAKIAQHKKLALGLILVVAVVGIAVGASSGSGSTEGASVASNGEAAADEVEASPTDLLTTSNSGCFLSNYAYPAGNITDDQFSASSASQCQTICQLNNDCDYFTFAASTCYLKSGFPTLGAGFNGATSGLKDCGLSNACHFDNKNSCCSAKFANWSETCNEPLGVSWILDASGSIGSSNWRNLRSFVAAVTTDYAFCFESTYLATTIYSTDVSFSRSYDASEVNVLITDLFTYSYNGGWTNTPKAMTAATSTLTAVLAALGLSATGTNDLVFSLTDGFPNCLQGTTNCGNSYVSQGTAATNTNADALVNALPTVTLVHIPIGSGSVEDLFSGMVNYANVVNVPKIVNWNNLQSQVAVIQSLADLWTYECTSSPSVSPSESPSSAPSASPTAKPNTVSPTLEPTASPSQWPSAPTTGLPTLEPTASPSPWPSAPTSGSPTTPTSGSPSTASPTTSSPTTASPTTASPTTSSPTTGSPTTGSPTASTPTTSSPTTASPTTASPTTASPTSASPTTASPTTRSPTTRSPTTASPTTASPTTTSPTTASPTTRSPTTASPTTGSPTTASPTTSSPTTASPTTASPTTGSPTTGSPSTSSPSGFAPSASVAPSASPTPCKTKWKNGKLVCV